ncbi:zinc finger protein 318-like isoform X2 [Neoarius graeffei]|uniref:zinc finger protein 318-like isoform X2 n=1 Tax=Neoarius graeffei TaxID=443677 RepID=UPI00298C82F1|nr:zinc finger protein 318-like isoform X2 [Neoarius graeffei]
MYRGSRPHRGAYHPAAGRGFAPRGPPPAGSFPRAPYRHEHARGSNGYPHDYRRHPEHPRRRCSSPGRGSAEELRGDGPAPRDYGHRYTPSPPRGGLPTDHSLVITVGNELTGLSQSSGAEIPYTRDYSSHRSSYEGYDEYSSRRHSPSRHRNRSCSPDHNRSRPRSRAPSQEHRSRSSSRTRSSGRSRAVNRVRSKSWRRSRSRGRSRSHSGGSSYGSSGRNSKRDKEDFRELERARRRKELGDMLTMPTKSILKKRIDSSETDSPMIGQWNSGSGLSKDAEQLLCTVTKKMDPDILASVLALNSNASALEELISKLQPPKESGHGFTLPYERNSQQNSDLTQLLSVKAETGGQTPNKKKSFMDIKDEEDARFPAKEMSKSGQHSLLDVSEKTGSDVLRHDRHRKGYGHSYRHGHPEEDESRITKQSKCSSVSPGQHLDEESRSNQPVTGSYYAKVRAEVEEYKKIQDRLKTKKSIRETKDKSYSTSLSQISQFSHQDCDQASTSEGSPNQFSASRQKSNLATQMERFLGALSKADSNLLSSMLRDARKDSGSLENPRIPQEQANRKASCNKYCDLLKKTDCSKDNYHLMGSKQNVNPILEQTENTQNNLLPHERAVVDGSGFSRIVGMKYGFEGKPENRFLYGEEMPSSSQGRLLEEHENFLKVRDEFKQSQGRSSDEPYAEDRERYKKQKPSESYRVEGSLSPVHQKSENANEDEDQKANQYQKIQDLLQTIGLNLDRTEVSKLSARTNERLYGKKVKPQSSHSLDPKDEQSRSRYDRRGSSRSADSEGVYSVSPAKTSNREVYMSYLDSIKYRRDEVAVKELDLLGLKRTIRNSPEAKRIQVHTSDPYETTPSAEVTHDSSKTSAEPSLSLTQSVGLQYPQISSGYSSAVHHLKNEQDSWKCSYTTGGEQNPYGSVALNPLHYGPGYLNPPSHFPSGYGYYTAFSRPSSMMPPSPGQFYPAPSTFTTPTVGLLPACPYAPTSGQFGFAMQPGSSGYATQQAKTKPIARNRCLKTIETETSGSVKPSAVKEVCTVISIQTENEPKNTDNGVESQVIPMMEDDIKAKQKKREKLCKQK